MKRNHKAIKKGRETGRIEKKISRIHTNPHNSVVYIG